MIKICAYVISEFGSTISEELGKSYRDQFALLDTHFYVVSNPAKAILMTSYMKMVKNCPELKNEVVPVLNQYKDHWDEELQQRACEYIYMIDKSAQDPKIRALVNHALDKMPNFSETLQTNNVLTRRILQMKVDKGFATTKEEAEKAMRQNMNQFQTNVS